MTREQAIKTVFCWVEKIQAEFGTAGYESVHAEASETLLALGVSPEEMPPHRPPDEVKP